MRKWLYLSNKEKSTKCSIPLVPKLFAGRNWIKKIPNSKRSKIDSKVYWIFYKRAASVSYNQLQAIIALKER